MMVMSRSEYEERMKQLKEEIPRVSEEIEELRVEINRCEQRLKELRRRFNRLMVHRRQLRRELEELPKRYKRQQYYVRRRNQMMLGEIINSMLGEDN